MGSDYFMESRHNADRDLSKARVRIEKLEEALEEYGEHALHCTSRNVSPNDRETSSLCSCGFLAALKDKP